MERRSFLARAGAFLAGLFGAKVAHALPEEPTPEPSEGMPYRTEAPGVSEQPVLTMGEFSGAPSVYEGPTFTVVEIEHGGVYESTDGLKHFGMRCDGCGKVSSDEVGPNILEWYDEWKAEHVAHCGRFVRVQ